MNDLWKLDVVTREWSELEQRGSRPCARMIFHGKLRLMRAQLIKPHPCNRVTD